MGSEMCIRDRISGPMVTGGDVTSNFAGPIFAWSEDSTRVLYLADQLVDNRFELFVTAPDGGIVNAAIAGELVSNGDVISFGLE